MFYSECSVLTQRDPRSKACLSEIWAVGEEAMKHAIRLVQSGSSMWRLVGPLLRGILAAVVGWHIVTFTYPAQAVAKEAYWIWSPEQTKNEVPEGSCYFRKDFTVQDPLRVQATIAADDEYELYVNGQKIGDGRSYRELDEYNITKYVKRGHNTIAVRVNNRRGSTAALVARIFLREKDSGWVTYSTDETWRTNIRPFPFWNAAVYNDRLWKPAQTFGKLGDTVPWDRQEDVASTETHRSERFRIAKEFQVQRVIDPEETGSVIAMAFNEFGQIDPFARRKFPAAGSRCRQGWHRGQGARVLRSSEERAGHSAA